VLKALFAPVRCTFLAKIGRIWQLLAAKAPSKRTECSTNPFVCTSRFPSLPGFNLINFPVNFLSSIIAVTIAYYYQLVALGLAPPTRPRAHLVTGTWRRVEVQNVKPFLATAPGSGASPVSAGVAAGSASNIGVNHPVPREITPPSPPRRSLCSASSPEGLLSLAYHTGARSQAQSRYSGTVWLVGMAFIQGATRFVGYRS